jgi:hypothetical protein
MPRLNDQRNSSDCPCTYVWYGSDAYTVQRAVAVVCAPLQVGGRKPRARGRSRGLCLSRRPFVRRQRQQAMQNETNTRQQGASSRQEGRQNTAQNAQQSYQKNDQNEQQSLENYGQNAQQSRQNFANNYANTYGSAGANGAWYGGGSPGTWGGYYAGMATAGAAGLAIGATVASLPAQSTPIAVQGDPHYYSGGVYYAPQGNGYTAVPRPKGAVIPSVSIILHDGLRWRQKLRLLQWCVLRDS